MGVQQMVNFWYGVSVAFVGCMLWVILAGCITYLLCKGVEYVFNND